MTSFPYNAEYLGNSTSLPRPEDSRVVICGTARDVERRLSTYFRVMQESFALFREVVFLVCESNSSDKTREFLLEWQKNQPNVMLIDDNGLESHSPYRTVRIASARNRLKQEVLLNYSDFDYVVMSDMDGVNKDLSLVRVMSCWSHANWDVATANQPLRYYDIAALRVEGWCPNDCWREYDELREFMSDRKAMRIAVSSKTRSIKPRHLPIDVTSAFGGLAIYRMKAFKEGKYSGVDYDQREICEHVPFHEQISAKGFRIMIVPSLVNLNPLTQVVGMIKGSVKESLKRLAS